MGTPVLKASLSTGKSFLSSLQALTSRGLLGSRQEIADDRVQVTYIMQPGV